MAVLLLLLVVAAATWKTESGPLDPGRVVLLEPLPAHGIAIDEGADLLLYRLGGATSNRLVPLGRVPTTSFIGSQSDGDPGVVFRDGDRRYWMLAVGETRARPVSVPTIDLRGTREASVVEDGIPDGCSAAGHNGTERLLICGGWAPQEPSRVIALSASGEVRELVGYPDIPRLEGWYTGVEVSPREDWLVIQHGGECEVPRVFFAPLGGGRPMPAEGDQISHEGVAASKHLGWLPDGRALIHFKGPHCSHAIEQPGLYAVAGPGEMELIHPTSPDAAVGLW